MCHLHQSVIKRRANQKIEANVVEIEGEKKITLFVCGEGGITNLLNTPFHQVQLRLYRRKRHLCPQAKVKMKQSKASFMS